MLERNFYFLNFQTH